MFAPYSVMISPVDPIEQSRIRAGRPASRAEILDRHLREDRIDAAHAAGALVSPITFTGSNHPAIHGAPVIAFDRVRRGISRFLMSAAQRIEPEAA